MKAHILKSIAFVLLFLGVHIVSAQDEEGGNPPRVTRFVTLGFKPVEFLNDRYSLYEFELGYEQFITRNTSIVGAVSYGTGKQYIRTFQGEILDEFSHRRYSIHTGLRSRLLNNGRFSLFGELQAGIRREEQDISRPSTNTLGFLGAGIGVEYRFSGRMKATFGITSQYSSNIGLETSFNLGLQIGLGKKK